MRSMLKHWTCKPWAHTGRGLPLVPPLVSCSSACKMEKLSNLGIATRCSQSLHCGWEAPNVTQLRTSLARSSVCCGDRSHSPAGRRLCTAPQGAATEDGLDPFELVRVELGQLTDNIGDLIRTVRSAVRYASAMIYQVVDICARLVITLY